MAIFVLPLPEGAIGNRFDHTIIDRWPMGALYRMELTDFVVRS